MKKNNQNTSSKYGIVILVMLCLAIAVPDFGQFQVNTLAEKIRSSMNLTQSQYSSVATAPLLAGIVFGLIAGLLMDRFGIKVVFAALAFSTFGLVLRVFAGNFWTLYLSGVMMGCAATFVNSTAPKIISRWFPAERVTVLMGILLSAANLALALGGGTASLFGSVRSAFTFTAIFGGVVLVLWLALVRDQKGAQGKQEPEEEKAPMGESIRKVIRDKRVWLSAVFAFGGIVGSSSASVFLPQALMSEGMTEAKAGWISMAITIGNTVSCFLNPILISRFATTKKKLKLMILIFSIGVGVLDAFAWRTSGVLLIVLLFIQGYLSMGFVGFFQSLPTRMDGIGRRYSGTATGLVLTGQLAASVVIPSYIIAPIAGDNYPLLFLLLGVTALVPVILIKLVPVDDMYK